VGRAHARLDLISINESDLLTESGPMTISVFVPTSEQADVIAHRGGHLQVIACAGAGKIEAISRRVAALIDEGAEPSQIVAFTFTERAAESLKARISRRVAEVKGPAYLDRLGPMFVGTIHAYCLRLLQDHVPEFGNFIETIRNLNLADY
jgi:ATP-dependent DNA helicase UvrD/PcrA